MVKRTTIEIDQRLLERARLALGEATTRATVEHALRLAAETVEAAQGGRAERQKRYLRDMRRRLDARVLASEKMWR
jgi:Arc/MetJ family transcription regulator